MAKLEQVHHLNWIGHEINDSLDNYPDSDREVYCRKLNRVVIPMRRDCDSCPCFAGWMMGHGHECVWDDVPDPDGYGEFNVPHDDRFRELSRVSRLIDDGTLTRRPKV